MEIPLEDRQKQSQQIMTYLINGISDLYLPPDMPELSVKQKIIHYVYNHAIDDVINAIDVYIEHNPQHRLALESLKTAIAGWMHLV